MARASEPRGHPHLQGTLSFARLGFLARLFLALEPRLFLGAASRLLLRAPSRFGFRPRRFGLAPQPLLLGLPGGIHLAAQRDRGFEIRSKRERFVHDPMRVLEAARREQLARAAGESARLRAARSQLDAALGAFAIDATSGVSPCLARMRDASSIASSQC